MKTLLYSMAGLLMVGSLPAVAQAGHRGGGSHWDVSIGFGRNSYNSWSSTRINFGEGRGNRDRGNWDRDNWNRGYRGRDNWNRGNWGNNNWNRGSYGGNYYYSTPSYRYYQPRSYCPPEVVYSPPPVVYVPPVLICRPPVVYNPPCYNYPSGTYYDVNIGFSYGR